MKRALGIDHGEARIGLAISDELGMLAHPLETIRVKDVRDSIGRIAQIVARDDIDTIILGMPRNMDGTYGPAAAKVKLYAEKLRARIPSCTVRTWDERLTSVAAQRVLHDNGLNVKKGRQVIDQVAAHLILQGWLDSQAMLG